MTINSHTQFTRLIDAIPEKSYGSLVREIAGESILINKNLGIAVKADALSRYIWELCDGENSVGDIMGLLNVLYPSDAARLRADINDTLLQFEDIGFIQFPGLNVDAGKEIQRLDLREITFYIINCEEDVDKKAFMQKQLESLGLKFEFIRGVKCDPYSIGTTLSHLKILKRKDLKLPFAILEDDCQFNENLEYVYDIPVNADALYLGVSHYGLDTDGEFGWGGSHKTRFTQFTKDLLRVYNMLALHGVVYLSEDYHQNAIESSLQALTSKDYAYAGDIEFAMLQKHHLVLTPNDPLCYQSEIYRGSHDATKSSLRTSANNFVDKHAPNDMEIYRDGEKRYYLFLDVFIHSSGNKITAVAPFYDEDISWSDHGIYYDQIVLLFGPFTIIGKYIPYRLDSWEPSIIIDFEHPLLEAYIREKPLLNIEIRAGRYNKHFILNTQVQASYETAMSLVIKNENRWVKTYLDYYLECMAVGHVFLYDNNTEDKCGLLNILAPYIDDKKLTYISWNYRWRNGHPCKQIGQPPQEVQCLNKYGATKWIGFFDIDEFLRIPGKNIPEFLRQYDAAKVGGVSFGLRWFMYKGESAYNEIDNPLLECLYSRRSSLGRKRQKLFVSPQDVRFMRFHWIEEGQREIQVDDEDIFFHHYYLTEGRFEEGKQEDGLVYDDYMLHFSDQLSDLQKRMEVRPVKVRPESVQSWIDHVDDSFNQAESGKSRLNNELLSLEGMSGTFTRHFYNNLCNLDSCHYLEIGCWKGASLSAAMYGNAIQVTAIDNWSEFRWPDREDPRDVFIRNINLYKGECNLTILEQDCFEINREALDKIDIYLFDGNHTEESQYRAIEYYYPVLSNLAVIIIDDWNFPAVRKGTKRAVETQGINVEYSKEIILPDDEVADMPRHKGRYGWWNGICIMLINKQG